jgi:hypothetical protein
VFIVYYCLKVELRMDEDAGQVEGDKGFQTPRQIDIDVPLRGSSANREYRVPADSSGMAQA